MLKVIRDSCYILLIITLFYSLARPAGFQVYNQDAAAVGMGNCFASIADNPSAVFYNPAGINRLEGTQMRTGFHLFLPETSFKETASKKKSEIENDFSALLTGYMTHKVNERISIGAGIFTPYGLVSDWPAHWEGRTISTYSDLRTYCVNPVVSIRLNSRLSLALGLDYLYSDFKLRRVIDPNKLIGLPLGISEGSITLKGFDDSFGYNLGVLLHLSDRWKMGISYRSKFKLEFDGHAHYHLPLGLDLLYPSTDISPRVQLPPTVAWDISTRVGEKCTIAAGFLWTGWSVYDELKPHFRDYLLIPPSMRSEPQDWRDVFAFNCGVRYQIKHPWVIRGGYIFDQSPVPEHTLGPMVPCTDGHLLSFGLGYSRDSFLIDLGCMSLLREKRRTGRNLNNFNGEYTTSWISIYLSFSYLFN